MKFLFLIMSLLLFSVACSSPQEKYDDRRAEAQEEFQEEQEEAQEDYEETMKKAEEDYLKNQKQEAKDYIDDSEGAKVNEDDQTIDVQD